MKISFAYLCVPLLILTGCKGGSDDDVASIPEVSPPDISQPSSNCFKLVEETICIAASFEGNSGNRIHIPFTEIPSEVSTDELVWSARSIDTPVNPSITPTEDGAYVILPSVDEQIDFEILVSHSTSSENAVSTGTVSPGSSLVLNGLNLVTLEEDGSVYLEWLDAVDKVGSIQENVTYTIEATALDQQGKELDTQHFITRENRYSALLELGQTYRFVLSVEGTNGETTESPHVDYTVPQQVPKRRLVYTDSAPNLSQYNIDDLIEVNATTFIVRQDDNIRYLDEPSLFELYSDEAPLDISLTVATMTPIHEESVIKAQSNQFPARNTFKIIQQAPTASYSSSGGVIEGVKSCAAYTKATNGKDTGTGKDNMKAELSVKYEMCLLNDRSNFSCTHSIKGSSHPKASAHCIGYFNVEHELEFKAKGEFVLQPAGYKIDYKGVIVDTGIGIKVEYAAPITAKMKFRTFAGFAGGFNAVRSKDDGTFFGRSYAMATVDIKKSGDKLVELQFSEDAVIPVSAEVFLGINPKVALENYAEVEGQVGIKTEMKLGAIPFGFGRGLETTYKLSWTEAEVKAKPIAEAKIQEVKGKLSIVPIKYEGPQKVLYKHPEFVTFETNTYSQCVPVEGGYYNPANGQPVDSVDGFGPLNPGDQYGDRIRREVEGRLISSDVEIGTSYSSNSDLDVVHRFADTDWVFGVYFDEMPGDFYVNEHALLAFNTKSAMGQFFPFYARLQSQLKYEVDSIYPWACWGEAFKLREESWIHQYSLKDLLDIKL